MLTIIGLVGGGVVAAIVIAKVLFTGKHNEAGSGSGKGSDKVRAIDEAILKDPDNGNLYFEKYRVLMDSDINDSWIPPLTKAIELGNEEARKERVALQIVGTFVVIDKYLAGKDYFKALDLLDKDIRVWADEKNSNAPPDDGTGGKAENKESGRREADRREQEHERRLLEELKRRVPALEGICKGAGCH